MEPTLAKPVKKRRRWLIAALLLLLLSFAWWHWPRRDPRFVGKWRGSVGHQFWNLRANGMAILESNVHPAHPALRFHTTWTSHGNVLIIGRSPFAPPRPAWQNQLLTLITKYLPSHQILNQGVCIHLKIIEPDRLEGVDGPWPDEPPPDPNEIRIKTTVWWDDFEGTSRFGGDIEYKFRKGHIPSALERLAARQNQDPEAKRRAEQNAMLFKRLQEIDAKKRQTNNASSP